MYTQNKLNRFKRMAQKDVDSYVKDILEHSGAANGSWSGRAAEILILQPTRY